MKREREILKKHFGEYYPRLEKWEFFNHILNAMNEIANEGSVDDMMKQCDPQAELFEEEKPIWKRVIEYLNIKAGKNFRFVKSSQRLIEARLKEGYSLEDFYTVIAVKTKEWKGSSQAQYLRPKTLFNASNFEGYLNQEEIQELTGDAAFEYNPSEEPDLL